MLEKFPYLAFGLLLGAAVLLTLTNVTSNSAVASKTSRLEGAATPSYNVAPADFAIERFG